MNSPKITPKQSEVLYYLAKAYSNQEISDAMGVSVSTVKLHLRSIFLRLNVNCRTKALITAETLNLVPKRLPSKIKKTAAKK